MRAQSQLRFTASALSRNALQAHWHSLAEWRRLPCHAVPIRTLDSVLEQFAPKAVKVVKIDVEGHECSAMKGGQTLFTRFRPMLIMSEWKERRVAKCVEEHAKRHGYVPGVPWGPDRNVAIVDGHLHSLRPGRRRAGWRASLI